MKAVRLLEHAISREPETVLDVGSGNGQHALSFVANNATVTGIDVKGPGIVHPRYTHVQEQFETAQIEPHDMIWCSHTLEHVPNVQGFLLALRDWLKDDGWLYIAVPPDSQQRFHIGHLTLWTPAHLIYNLICAGWDCTDAQWYTEYCTIGLCVRKKPEIDFEGRTGMPDEVFWLNQYTPIPVRHEDGAWWGNRWDDETIPRVPDPPAVTIGHIDTNLPPEVQLAFGPNPELRKPPGKLTSKD